jgi:hypothetical protein
MTMNRYLKYFAIGLLALAVFVPAASARPFYVGGYWGPGFYYGPGYGWYGPGWAPYASVPAPNVGKVKFDTKAKDAMVYVDGGYAGTVGSLKTFPLRAGTHNIELRDPSGHAYFQESVNVIGGKTTTLNPQ